MKKTNIILIGMPACGKTYFCNKLSEKLKNYTPYDIDSIIERTSGMSICDIFKTHSEDYFRKLEYDTIKTVCNGNYKIISVGGGAFENPDNRNTLLHFGLVFYLKSDLDVLYYRISGDNKRPLLNCENPKETLQKLLNKREENYKMAHYTLDINKLSEDEIINFILGSINETSITC